MRDRLWVELRSLAWIAFLVSCQQDERAPGQDCLVVSPNNTWQANNVTMAVTSPKCPVVLSNPGQLVGFSSKTRAPYALPFGLHTIAVFDDGGFRVATFVAEFSPISASQKEANTTGNYFAGSAGYFGGGVVQDVAIAQFPVAVQYGSTASAEALLPYKFTSSQSVTYNITSSQNIRPKIGVPTWVRVVPQINETITPVTGFQWYFNNLRVMDTFAPHDPRYPVSPGRWFRAKVQTRGTHTWRVIMTYGAWPAPPKTATVTWTQTYY